jgi:hypothetical protein
LRLRAGKTAHGYNDSACKIVSSQNQIVIGVDGLANINREFFRDDAVTIANHSKFIDQSDLDAIAIKWGKLVADSYRDALSSHDRSFFDGLEQAKRGHFDTYTEGIFIGLSKSGAPLVISLQVNLLNGRTDQAAVVVGNPDDGKQLSTDHPMLIVALAFGRDTLNELNASKSARAKKNAAFYHSNLANDQQAEDYVEQLTTIAGEWYPAFVGGPTDVAVITPGGVNWTKRKFICTR